MTMKRKEYEKPTMQVVQLKQQPMLLAGSVTGDAGIQNYYWNDNIPEE